MTIHSEDLNPNHLVNTEYFVKLHLGVNPGISRFTFTGRIRCVIYDLNVAPCYILSA